MAILDIFYKNCSRCGNKELFIDNNVNKLKILKKIKEFDNSFENYDMLCMTCWNDIKTKNCSMCNEKIDVVDENYIKNLDKLNSTTIDKTEYESLKRLCAKCWDSLRLRRCNICDLLIDVVAENKIKSLKAHKAYRKEYEQIKFLCPECFEEAKKVTCGFCNINFYITDDKKNELLTNLKNLNVSKVEVESMNYVCNECMEKNLYIKCSICKIAYRELDNKIRNYSENKQFKELLSPYSPDYHKPRNGKSICPNCYESLCISVAQVQSNLYSWIEGVRGEHIPGYETLKVLGHVSYKGDNCAEPAEVKEILKLYSCQLGGNAFIDFFWKKHEERNAERVLAGHSENNNPYYRTEYTINTWFTGSATAVLVAKKISIKKSNCTEVFVEENKIKKVVLDGLNICYWNSEGEKKINISNIISLCISLANKNIEFTCFFDANASYLISEYCSEHDVKIYKELIGGKFSKYFKEVPGGIRADLFILQKANRDNSHIISNDNYRDYIERYLWIDKSDRLLKGMIIDNKVLIPNFGFECRLFDNIETAISRLKETI